MESSELGEVRGAMNHFAYSTRAVSSSPDLLYRSVELHPLMGYRFGEDLRIAHAREIGHIYSRPAGSATD